MSSSKTVSQREFVILMALLMSLAALAIDTMLPALSQMGESLGVEEANHMQLVVSTVFLGMSLGLMVYGPISDSFGRKRAIYLGVSIFILGSILSLVAQTFQIMLLGRVIQGFGAASTRVVTGAMIRDNYKGNEMARIMSLIMIIFVLVPAFAPSIGQVILFFTDWRGIFWLFFILASITLFWFHQRLPETLAKEKRLKFSLPTIYAGSIETLKNPVARGYTVTSGLIFGSFVGYLSSAQQIIQIQYDSGTMFSIYFGILALSVGVASFANSRLVTIFGMQKLCTIALSVLSINALLFLALSLTQAGHPPLVLLILYLMLTFFSFGILFGNLNAMAMAMEPLGHIAGVANSVISSVQTLISVCIGSFIGYQYDGTVIPLVSGFSLMGILSLLIVLNTHKKYNALRKSECVEV